MISPITIVQVRESADLLDQYSYKIETTQQFVKKDRGKVTDRFLECSSKAFRLNSYSDKDKCAKKMLEPQSS